MHKINLKFHNKTKIIYLLGFLFFFFFIAILIPLGFINYFSFSGISHFFMENLIFGLISGIFLLYFIIIGQYYYTIKIDAYIIQVTSYRPILEFFKEKDYVDIPHTMLADYAFFNRPLSLNKTLMLKIQSDKGKRVIKRFHLTLMSKKEIEKICSALDRIIAKNN